MFNPIDLLPIPIPFLSKKKHTGIDFYKDVVQHLLPDVIKIMNNGIPINLDKVKKLEEVVNSSINNAKDSFNNNELIKKFLTTVNKEVKQKELEELDKQKKTYIDYLKPYDNKNKIHRTYLVNYYLESIYKPNMTMESWSIKDLKKLNTIIESSFIQNIIDDKPEDLMKVVVENAMIKLAVEKANIYNKHITEKRMEKLQDLSTEFNPSSSVQIKNLFSWLGIDSETLTPKGNPKWDRNELEKLQKLINNYLEKEDGKKVD